ncbi:TonB-dependent receptor [Aliidiomarina quisquiliarum]|uniref:TonB-dependent receptor n=1 Tax=Aliidiomarina quisquiliarum TaxID=2938947 RepID=UPI00208F10A7|nr:TonB-dependent receptor [Aliidiomarina quisquiliarum]MCO4322520.1 TonB-dependent receptor [Aliidiomarina quisquiliarum]
MRQVTFKRSLCALAVTAAMAGMMATAVAQEQEANEQGKTEARTLERIEVTARRTIESIQDVPVAVTSISDKDLQERGISTILEVAQFSPNTTLQQSRGTNSTITAFIRGVGQEDPLWGYEPGVGIYIDDIYVARPQGAVLDILNVERVEVLRGPQGTLYGKNTIGGAVKYVTRRMSGEREFFASGTVGSFNQRDLKLTGEIPLIDNTLYFGFGYANLQRDGYGKFLTSALPNQDMQNYDKDLQAMRGTVEWYPSEDVFVRLAYDRTDDKSNSKGGYRLLPSIVTNAPVPDSIYDSYTSLPTENKVETEGVSLTVDWEFSDAITLRSITSRRENYSPVNIDFDNTSERIFDVPAIYEDKWFTQEFQMNYRTDNLTVVSGVYYYDAESCGVFDAILEVLGQGAFGTPGLTREVAGCSDSTSQAAYAQGTYNLSDKWSVTAGLRYTRDKKEALVRNGLVFDTIYPESGWIPGYVRDPSVGTPVVLDDSKTWNKLTPRVGVEYRHSRDTMFYASFGQGFKSGTFNPRAETAEPAANPEDVYSYEIGVKSDVTNSLRVNATAFMLDHKNRQYVSVIPDPNDATVLNQRLANVGTSDATGFELEVTWIASNNLAIYGNLGLIDANFSNVMSFDAQGNQIDITDSFVITNTPKTTANIGFSYDTTLANGDLVFNGNYSYRSSYGLNELDNLLTQDAYGMLNLGINWYSANGKWNVGLHGKNLTQEEFLVGNYAFLSPDPANPGQFLPGLGGDTTLIGYYGEPRTVSLTVGYRF